MSNLECSKIMCSDISIIRFEYDIEKRGFCLEHLIEFIEYIRDEKLFHLLTDTKKIIPIYTIKD